MRENPRVTFRSGDLVFHKRKPLKPVTVESVWWTPRGTELMLRLDSGIVVGPYPGKDYEQVLQEKFSQDSNKEGASNGNQEDVR